MDDIVDYQITAALEKMIEVWDKNRNYASSKEDWNEHYFASIELQRVYRQNINRFIDDETTPLFLENLARHIEQLEIYRDYGFLVNP